MKIVVSVVLIGVVGFAYAYFLRKTNGNVGTGLGRNYMRDYWGIDEEDKEQFIMKWPADYLLAVFIP